MPLLYALTLFTSAMLLFLVQPMFAKMVLPLLGGTPAVWNTCMVFYQAALLAGYVYAHLSIRLLGPRRQAGLHLLLVLVPWLVLPITVVPGWTPSPDANPIPWLLGLLSLSVGLPFLAISATGPMLQAWFADTGHPAAKDPYFLYAASNAGSMLALLGYPILFEPTLPLAEQSKAWAMGYALLSVMLVLSAVALWRSRPAQDTAGAAVRPDPETEPSGRGAPTWRLRLWWLLLAFVPSSLMLGVTTHISTDIASVPLLWVVPLALYLLTFILVFARRQILPHHLMLRLQPLFVLTLAAWFCLNLAETNWLMVPLHLATFFVVTMVCHGELAASRPDAKHLTEFYLWMSLGGVLGGTLNAIVAPLMFSTIIEYPLVLAASCLLRPWTGRSTTSWRPLVADFLVPAILAVILVALVRGSNMLGHELPLWQGAIVLGVAALVCLSFVGRPLRLGLGVATIMLVSALLMNQTGPARWGVIPNSLAVAHLERSFFGVIRVRHDDAAQTNTMVHGSTRHGMQSFKPELRREPLTYYHRGGPLGQAMAMLENAGRLKQIAVIGLGTGSIAAYGRPGMEITYYEIDPAVLRLAKDPRYFSYLADSQARVNVVLGDARLMIAAAPPRGYDLIAVDAFSSDSIPIHLITREALHLYLDKLADGGLIAMHISNRYLRLEPIVGRLAQEAGLECLAQRNDVSEDDRALGKESSHWAVLARRPADLKTLAADRRWHRPKVGPRVPVWTDDFSNILSVFNWR
jgi:SAM-dependent methyltransferase